MNPLDAIINGLEAIGWVMLGNNGSSYVLTGYQGELEVTLEKDGHVAVYQTKTNE